MDKRTQHHYDKATQTYWRPPSHAVSPHIHSSRESGCLSTCVTKQDVWHLKLVEHKMRAPPQFNIVYRHFPVASLISMIHSAIYSWVTSLPSLCHLPVYQLKVWMSFDGRQLIRLSKGVVTLCHTFNTHIAHWTEAGVGVGVKGKREEKKRASRKEENRQREDG